MRAAEPPGGGQRGRVVLPHQPRLAAGGQPGHRPRRPQPGHRVRVPRVWQQLHHPLHVRQPARAQLEVERRVDAAAGIRSASIRALMRLISRTQVVARCRPAGYRNSSASGGEPGAQLRGRRSDRLGPQQRLGLPRNRPAP